MRTIKAKLAQTLAELTELAPHQKHVLLDETIRISYWIRRAHLRQERVSKWNRIGERGVTNITQTNITLTWGVSPSSSSLNASFIPFRARAPFWNRRLRRAMATLCMRRTSWAT